MPVSKPTEGGVVGSCRPFMPVSKPTEGGSGSCRPFMPVSKPTEGGVVGSCRPFMPVSKPTEGGVVRLEAQDQDVRRAMHPLYILLELVVTRSRRKGENRICTNYEAM